MFSELINIPKKVIFVDDELLAIKTFERDLKNTDYEVITVRNPQNVLQLIEKEKVPIIVVDYRMPDIDGITLLKKVRDADPNIISILVSAYADLNVVVKAINEVGIFRAILKPWHREELIVTLEKGYELYCTRLLNRLYSESLVTKNRELEELTKNLENEVHRRTVTLLIGLLRALDLRDTETQWHSRRVTLYSKKLAQVMGLTSDELIEIERGALLHDIGKIGVSDTILLKPGKLTFEEFEKMKRHTIYGYEIVKDIYFLGNGKLIVLQHHERWDGKGYPYGLKGEDIYIGARIFAVIDAYDAITSDRPYRKALPHETAIEEIEKNRETQFDPMCVEAFLSIDKSELLELKEIAREESKFTSMLG